MAMLRAIFLICTSLWICDTTYAQGDSLRSALNAIQQRQRDLEDYDDNIDYETYPFQSVDELAFLNKDASYGANDFSYNKNRALSDYTDDDIYEQNVLNKRLSSSFRERVEEDREKQFEEFLKNLIRLENNHVEANGDDDYMREIWEKYYGNSGAYDGDMRAFPNKYYYPEYRRGNMEYRKRYNVEPYSVHHHVPRENDEDYSELKKRYQGPSNFMKHHRYSQLTKRFPVSKRSSSGVAKPEVTHEEKRSIKRQTDPKVEKDLSDIFGSKKHEHSENLRSSSTTKPSTTTAHREKKKTKTKVLEENKEVAPRASSDKPLQIKKKSIDWSDYFGLDRRKKSDNGLDREWLLERYHKALAVSAKKRNAEVAMMHSLQNQENPLQKEKAENIADKSTTKTRKLDDIDAKLRKIEDRIVDDTLKYTGAHEDDVDTKEVQQIKDNVISRLAAAYSLEKMRNALEEYKLSLAKEKTRLKQEGKYPEDYLSEKKRTSVPRKEAIDETLVEAENDIKCANAATNEDCHEQNYKTPTDVIESHFRSNGQCPSIQRACSDVASVIGHYGKTFEQPCNIHQMCLLCSNNSWFSPTQQCNMLFLSKASELCKGNLDCQKEAHKSVRYLLDINRSLQTQTPDNDDCELSCPDSDQMTLGN